MVAQDVSLPTPVVLSDSEGATRPEEESKDPENLSFAMPPLGVLPKKPDVFRCRNTQAIDAQQKSLYHRPMKKTKPAKRPSAAKGVEAQKKKTPSKNASPKATQKPAAPKRVPETAAPQTVDEYFDRLPAPALRALNKIRGAIRSVVPPEATEIISYRMPAFRHKKVLVWYAAFANHCSLFPTAAVIDAFKDELKGFSLSKGTIQFPTDKPMPIALIKKLVKARVGQNENKNR
jgi:uncharacterized protein YdhG (YjbR/CyaY superfamily)